MACVRNTLFYKSKHFCMSSTLKYAGQKSLEPTSRLINISYAFSRVATWEKAGFYNVNQKEKRVPCPKKFQVLLPPWKNRVDFTGYPSNHFSGCRLNGRSTIIIKRHLRSLCLALFYLTCDYWQQQRNVHTLDFDCPIIFDVYRGARKKILLWTSLV